MHAHVSTFRRGAIALAALLLAAHASAATVQMIEYYNASQDHYFVSSLAADITARRPTRTPSPAT
jgi:hypothetical protein